MSNLSKPLVAHFLALLCRNGWTVQKRGKKSFPSSLSDLPDNGPDILGGRPRYTVGDHVNVTCASRNSLPAAKLSWYINGEKADSNHLIPYSHETNHEGLQTSKLGLGFKVRIRNTSKSGWDWFLLLFPLLLHFQVDHKHFTRGDLKLKCTATISTVYWKSNEESVQGAGYNAFSTSMSPARGMSSGNWGSFFSSVRVIPFLFVFILLVHSLVGSHPTRTQGSKLCSSPSANHYLELGKEAAVVT